MYRAISSARTLVGHARLVGFLQRATLFVAFSAVYEIIRYLVGPGSDVVPLQHAGQVTDLERGLGLLVEPHVQRAAFAFPPVEDFVVWIYKYEHLTGSIVFLSWLYFWRPDHFPFVWRWFWIAHVLSILGFWLFPLAPPRLAPSLGLADPTAQALAATPGATAFDYIRNEFAAMPSLHVGYPLLFASVLWCVLPAQRVRWVVWVWPATMLFVVIATANHFWLDGVGGAVAVGVALWLTLRIYPRCPRPWDSTVRIDAPTAGRPAIAGQMETGWGPD